MNFALILSGGVGSRMRSDGFPKQYIEVKDKPILLYTLEKFQTCTAIDKIVIVADPTWQTQITAWMELSGISKFSGFASPGESRQESIFSGLSSCMTLSRGEDDGVIIHDGVRPLVSHGLICACLEALTDYDGSMPVLPVTDTTYVSQDGKHISGLLDRSTLFSGQAPEAFRLRPYYRINKEATKQELAETRGTTEIAYRHNFNIRLIPGEYGNFKLTTPTDLDRFRAILEENK